jgi:tripartite-type tricarboxylate transporter receptor subunit TctC
MEKINRRQALRFGAVFGAAFGLVGAGPVRAQNFPTKPLSVIVPFGPGGPSDVMARVIAAQLQSKLGQSVVVENRTGAGGMLGTQYVARSNPDGYTLLMGTIGTQVLNKSIYPKLPYDPDTQFMPVAFVTDAEGILVVGAQVPAANAAELIALAQKTPGHLSFGSGGAGTSSHLAGELFKSLTKVDIYHVPYRSNVAAVTDVAGGQVTMGFIPLSAALPFIKANRLKPLAIMGAARSPLLPDIPTLAESAVPGFEVRNWCAVFAPAGTPESVVTSLNQKIRTIMKSPAVEAQLITDAQRYTDMSPAELGKFIESENTKWTPIAKASGAKAE